MPKFKAHKQHSQPDLSDELLLFRIGNGIRLIQPEMQDKYQHHHLAYNTGFRVRDLMQQPVSFYFLNHQGETQQINAIGAEVCGFASINDSIGKSLLNVTKIESAQQLLHNCQIVMQENSIKLFDEMNIRRDNAYIPFLTLKAPWYDQNNKIIGTYGCSIAVGTHPLAESLSMLRKMGLLDADNKVNKLQAANTLIINERQLTAREMECLRLTIKGYTAKRIGQLLGISFRTVEEYINNIKVKIGATSKAELIEVAVDYFLKMDSV